MRALNGYQHAPRSVLGKEQQKEASMARKRDKLKYEPMYKYNPAETKPAKRKRTWRTVIWVLTLGLAGRDRRGR